MLRLGLTAAAALTMAGTVAASIAGAVPARAAETPLPIELNKLEPLPATGSTPAGCRVYFVVNNDAADTLTQLRLDLILFGTDGVIARRVALDLGPLPGKKTGVRLFDLTGQACDGIGKVLINDVLACQSSAAGQAAAPAPSTAAPATTSSASATTCLDRLTPTSRIASVTFGK